MKRIIATALLVTAAFIGANAQQDAAYSMYMFNGLYVNPAYAGSHEVINVMGIYRHQWVGIDGAPRTANISVHTPFRRDQYAVGLTISNDRLGLSNNFSVTPAFSYRLRLPKENRLCFGVQASFNYFYQNNGKAVLPSTGVDNSFALNENLFVPNIGFGIYAYGKRYFAGISAPHLMPSSLTKQVGVVKYNDAIARVYNFYVLTGGYVFGKDASVVKFRPTILVKWQKGLPKNIPQFDANLALLFIDRLWLGVGYRTETSGQHKAGQAIVAFTQFKVTPQLQIGYAYDAEISGLKRYTSGTHEIMIGYDFWYDKKRFVTPRFIKYF
ncbi:MAG: type IX secretion system membrane protein PorP/SprF [Chitinophagales bacterium]|nr:type IX secretion system membrane protein PorP/SprF [Chitinophagales bacterium]